MPDREKPKQYTIDELGKLVGLKPQQIRNWNALRKFSGPTVPSRGRIPALYGQEKIEELERLIERSKRVKTTLHNRSEALTLPYSAEEARKAFAMLRAGKGATDLVLELGLHPHQVRALMTDYGELAKCLVVSTEIMEQIHRLPLDGCFPIEDDKALLALLKDCSTDKCFACKERTRTHCRSCARSAP